MEVWEDHPEVWERSGVPPEGSGGVERHTQRSRRGQEVHLDVREALLEVQEGSGGPHRGPGGPHRGLGVGERTTQRSRSGREAHPEVREVSRGPP